MGTDDAIRMACVRGAVPEAARISHGVPCGTVLKLRRSLISS